MYKFTNQGKETAHLELGVEAQIQQPQHSEATQRRQWQGSCCRAKPVGVRVQANEARQVANSGGQDHQPVPRDVKVLQRAQLADGRGEILQAVAAQVQHREVPEVPHPGRHSGGGEPLLAEA